METSPLTAAPKTSNARARMFRGNVTLWLPITTSDAERDRIASIIDAAVGFTVSCVDVSAFHRKPTVDCATWAEEQAILRWLDNGAKPAAVVVPAAPVAFAGTPIDASAWTIHTASDDGDLASVWVTRADGLPFAHTEAEIADHVRGVLAARGVDTSRMWPTMTKGGASCVLLDA